MRISNRSVFVFIVLTLACILFAVQRRYEMKFTIKQPELRNTTSIRVGPHITSPLQGVSPFNGISSFEGVSPVHGFNGVSPLQGVSTGTFNISNINVRRRLLKSSEGQFVLHKLRIRNGEVQPEDLMTLGPFDFLQDYRNPCWRVETETFPPIKCLPYFYLAGAPKAGTTDLFFRIIRHPSVSYLTVKEPHWITRLHYYSKASSAVRPTLSRYIDFFGNAIKDVYRTTEENGWHPKVFGDGSASTLWDNDYWQLLPEFDNLTEPLYTNADYIHHLNPKTKIIAILRNPIDRLYSDYLYFHSTKSPEGFHDSVVKAIDYLTNCLSNNTLRACVYHRPPKTVRIRIGIYYIHLKEYLRVFPRSQIHVIKLEEYSKNISFSLEKVFKFLELESLNSRELAKISEQNNKNTRRPKDKAIGEMFPSTRKLLQDFYFPYNEELGKLLGENFNYNKDEYDREIVKLQEKKIQNKVIEADSKYAELLKRILSNRRVENDRKDKNIQIVPSKKLKTLINSN